MGGVRREVEGLKIRNSKFENRNSEGGRRKWVADNWLRVAKKRKKLCGLGVSAVKKVYRRACFAEATQAKGAEALRGWPRRSGALQGFVAFGGELTKEERGIG